MLFWLAGCGQIAAPSVPPTPPTTHGRVVHAGADTLVVQHDDLRGRVVTGIERYRWDGPGEAANGDAAAGDEVNLWLEGDEVVFLQPVERYTPSPAHRLKGTVVNIDGNRVMVDHEAIPGVMNAMVMGFGVAPWELGTLAPGATIEAHLIESPYGWQLVDIHQTGTVPTAARTDIAPLAPGEQLHRAVLTAEDGSEITVGAGQGVPTALTYIYTRCPDPSFCPAIAARMASLQDQLRTARIVTVSIDPDHDTPERLAAWGTSMGADFGKWRLARAEPTVLQGLALAGGQHVTADGGRISHLHRLLILDAEGKLIERYDDNRWPMDRVVQQLEGSGSEEPPERQHPQQQ